MAIITEDYQKLVLDDLTNYVGLYHPVKANFFERNFIKKLPINQLHPNPDDEFCMPEIGPNYGIVHNYETHFRQTLQHGIDPFEDKLVVEKMSTGGFLLLNGHHRWMAAHRIHVKKLPVDIVNVTKEEDILSIMNRSDKDMCVSFDLDEVLMTGEKSPMFPFSIFYKKSLKKNAAHLITELRRIGFDVWVYTGNYYSENYINTFFSIYRTKVDGIVNALQQKGGQKNLKEHFSKKYKLSVHIDNDSIVCVNTKTKEYDTIDITADINSWATQTIHLIKSMEMINNR